MTETTEQVRRNVLDLLNDCPEVAAMFATRQPRYRYYALGQRRFCWNTEPMAEPHPWRAFEYAPTGPGSRTGKATQWKLVREVNCSTRKAAKHRAMKWFKAASNK